MKQYGNKKGRFMKKQYFGIVFSISLIAQPMMAAHKSLIDWKGTPQQSMGVLLLPNRKGFAKLTQLSQYIVKGDTAGAQKLINAQISNQSRANFVNSYGSDPYKVTPLHYAAGKGNDNLINMLLTAGANPNAQDSSQCTPLMWAISNGKDKAATLLASKTDLTIRDNLGRTALHWVAAEVNQVVATTLLSQGAAVRAKDNQGNTPLHYAASVKYRFGKHDPQDDSGAAMSGKFVQAAAIATAGMKPTQQNQAIMNKTINLGMATPVAGVASFAGGKGSGVVLLAPNAQGTGVNAIGMPVSDTANPTPISPDTATIVNSRQASPTQVLQAAGGASAQLKASGVAAQANTYQALSNVYASMSQMSLAQYASAMQQLQSAMGSSSGSISSQIDIDAIDIHTHMDEWGGVPETNIAPVQESAGLKDIVRQGLGQWTKGTPAPKPQPQVAVNKVKIPQGFEEKFKQTRMAQSSPPAQTTSQVNQGAARDLQSTAQELPFANEPELPTVKPTFQEWYNQQTQNYKTNAFNPASDYQQEMNAQFPAEVESVSAEPVQAGYAVRVPSQAKSAQIMESKAPQSIGKPTPVSQPSGVLSYEDFLRSNPGSTEAQYNQYLNLISQMETATAEPTVAELHPIKGVSVVTEEGQLGQATEPKFTQWAKAGEGSYSRTKPVNPTAPKSVGKPTPVSQPSGAPSYEDFLRSNPGSTEAQYNKYLNLISQMEEATTEPTVAELHPIKGVSVVTEEGQLGQATEPKFTQWTKAGEGSYSRTQAKSAQIMESEGSAGQGAVEQPIKLPATLQQQIQAGKELRPVAQENVAPRTSLQQQIKEGKQLRSVAQENVAPDYRTPLQKEIQAGKQLKPVTQENVAPDYRTPLQKEIQAGKQLKPVTQENVAPDYRTPLQKEIQAGKQLRPVAQESYEEGNATFVQNPAQVAYSEGYAQQVTGAQAKSAQIMESKVQPVRGGRWRRFQEFRLLQHRLLNLMVQLFRSKPQLYRLKEKVRLFRR